MSLQSYLFGLKMSILVAFFAWASVVLYIDPESSGMFGKILFFTTFFLWSSGACTFFFTWIQKALSDDNRSTVDLGVHVRRGMFVSCFSVVLLILQYFHVLAVWGALLVGVAFLLIELHFTHHDSRQSDDTLDQKPKVQAAGYSRLKRKKTV